MFKVVIPKHSIIAFLAKRHLISKKSPNAAMVTEKKLLISFIALITKAILAYNTSLD